MQIILFYFLIFTFWLEQALNFKLTYIKGMSLMNLSIFMLLLFWAFKIVQKRKIFEPCNINKYIFLLIYVAGISIFLKIIYREVASVSLIDEIISLKNWSNPLMLFVIIYNTIEDETDCRKALLGLIFLLFACVLTTQLFITGVIPQLGGKVYKMGRASGFVEPNQYASYLVLFIPVVITFLLNAKRMVIKALISIFLFFILFDLMATGSRGGFVSFLFSLSVYFFLIFRAGIIRFSRVFLLIVVFVSIGYGSLLWTQSQMDSTVIDRLSKENSLSLDSYTSGRIGILTEGLSQFVKKPIFGHGNDMFGHLMKKELGKSWNSHNDYLFHLVNYGLVGFTVFIILYISTFRHVYVGLKNTADEWLKKMYISYLAGGAGYAMSMMFVNLFSPRYVFWVFTAIIYRIIQQNSANMNSLKTQPLCQESTEIV